MKQRLVFFIIFLLGFLFPIKHPKNSNSTWKCTPSSTNDPSDWRCGRLQSSGNISLWYQLATTVLIATAWLRTKHTSFAQIFVRSVVVPFYLRWQARYECMKSDFCSLLHPLTSHSKLIDRHLYPVWPQTVATNHFTLFSWPISRVSYDKFKNSDSLLFELVEIVVIKLFLPFCF